MSAAELREAAALIRERAEAATPVRGQAHPEIPGPITNRGKGWKAA